MTGDCVMQGKFRKGPCARETYRFTAIIGTITGSYDRLEIHFGADARMRETWPSARSYVMPLCGEKVRSES